MINVITPSVRLINEKDMLRKIELVGRVCYKSEDKITEDSAKRFVDNLIKRGHYSVLEHYVKHWVAYTITKSQLDIFEKYYKTIPHSNLTVTHISGQKYRVIFSANLRVLLENDLALYQGNGEFLFKLNSLFEPCDFDDIEDKTEEEILKHEYKTLRFITDRGVTHELVRHRKFSFAQESTRYVNYNNKGMTFILPSFLYTLKEEDSLVQSFKTMCIQTAENYNRLIDKFNLKPQDARAVLPNALKTEIIVTGNMEEWNHFFELRCAKEAHPDMQIVANMAKKLCLNLKCNNDERKEL